jgi:hypothetical protein
MIDALYDLLTTFAIVFILLNVIGNSRKLDKIDKKLSDKKTTRKKKEV